VCFLSLPFRVAPGPLTSAYERVRAQLEARGFAEALWSRRLDVWSPDRETQKTIGNRLGWLDATSSVTSQLERLRTFADGLRDSAFSDIVLLGMGGSSLAPEVLRQVLGVAPGYPPFRMLDSVDPDAVRDAFERAATSLFIVASKSGSTIEPNVLTAEARARVIASGQSDWASRFVTITDEHTALHHRALEDGFREIFVNPADIGGRYSALSLFGMVPAAAMGADVNGILAAARAMEAACRGTDVGTNPGLALGAFMAAGAETGRDKLTLMLSPEFASFGLWVEQLVAESTGKQGKGVVPIVAGETPGMPLGQDRMVVAVYRVGGPHQRLLDPVRTEGIPLFEIEVPDRLALGAEFFRWEIATATAGFLMGINPFDEPNVKQAKDATRELLDDFKTSGRLDAVEPHVTIDGATLTLSTAAKRELGSAGADRFLTLFRPGDYFGLLAYLPPDRDPFDALLREFQGTLMGTRAYATMFGYGPRYLHSTGQLHKGGANNGIFVMVTATPDEDLAIPGESFSFGILEMAQALGDFESLDREGRRALHVHLPRRDANLMRRVFERLMNA
jgi:glucose-6-phosphate isomerase